VIKLQKRGAIDYIDICYQDYPEWLSTDFNRYSFIKKWLKKSLKTFYFCYICIILKTILYPFLYVITFDTKRLSAYFSLCQNAIDFPDEAR